MLNLPWLFVAIFGSITAILWLAFRTSHRRFRALEARGVWVEGRVVKSEEVGRHDETFTVIYVEYRDASGCEHRIRSAGGSSLFPSVGAWTRVLHDRDDPTIARLEADRENAELIGPILIGAFGIVTVFALIAGVIVLLVA